MKGSKYIDTNVLIRIWEAKKEYVEWLRDLGEKKQTVYLPSIVIAEVIWVLTSFYKKTRQEIIEFIDTIGNTSGIKIVTKHDINKALRLFETSNIKFTDCMIAGYLQEKDIIVSEDRDFDKLEGVRRESVSIPKN